MLVLLCVCVGLSLCVCMYVWVCVIAPAFIAATYLGTAIISSVICAGNSGKVQLWKLLLIRGKAAGSFVFY